MKSAGRWIVALLVGLVVLAGCGSPAGGDSSASPSSDLLERYGLASLTTAEIVEKLDQSPETRPTKLAGSVRPDQLLLSEGDEQLALDMPDDQFYLSVAPYLTHSHDCFYHNTGSCQGELVNSQVHVTITTADGIVIVNRDATTYANGFIGFWVPTGSSGTITVSQDGKSGTVPFATGDQDATCITTLKLV